MAFWCWLLACFVLFSVISAQQIVFLRCTAETDRVADSNFDWLQGALTPFPLNPQIPFVLREGHWILSRKLVKDQSKKTCSLFLCAELATTKTRMCPGRFLEKSPWFLDDQRLQRYEALDIYAFKGCYTCRQILQSKTFKSGAVYWLTVHGMPWKGAQQLSLDFLTINIVCLRYRVKILMLHSLKMLWIAEWLFTVFLACSEITHYRVPQNRFRDNVFPLTSDLLSFARISFGVAYLPVIFPVSDGLQNCVQKKNRWTLVDFWTHERLLQLGTVSFLGGTRWPHIFGQTGSGKKFW